MHERKDSDFVDVTESETFDGDDDVAHPKPAEVPGMVRRLITAFRNHRANHRADEIQFNHWKTETLEKRLRKLEDRQTYVMAIGGTVWVLLTAAGIISAIITGILKVVH